MQENRSEINIQHPEEINQKRENCKNTAKIAKIQPNYYPLTSSKITNYVTEIIVYYITTLLNHFKQWK